MQTVKCPNCGEKIEIHGHKVEKKAKCPFEGMWKNVWYVSICFQVRHNSEEMAFLDVVKDRYLPQNESKYDFKWMEIQEKEYYDYGDQDYRSYFICARNEEEVKEAQRILTEKYEEIMTDEIARIKHFMALSFKNIHRDLTDEIRKGLTQC